MGKRVIVVGASSGGIQALCALVRQLPADFPAPVFIVQHTSPEGPGWLPHLLEAAGPLRARHPKSGEYFEAGLIYVAPPDRHMLIKGKQVWLSHGPRENRTRPAVDPLFRSAALAHGPAVVGVILTGYLDDGTAGSVAIKACGGFIMAQDPTEAAAASMPQSVLKHVPDVDYCGTLATMAERLVQLALDDAPASPACASRTPLEIETRIAAGEFDPADWKSLLGYGQVSQFGCPDCHGALCELPACGLLRFRCRAGHAFSAASLLQAYAESRETHLSALYALLLNERAVIEALLAGSSAQSEAANADLRQRIAAITDKSRQLQQWMRQTEDAAPFAPAFTGALTV